MGFDFTTYKYWSDPMDCLSHIVPRLLILGAIFPQIGPWSTASNPVWKSSSFSSCFACTDLDVECDSGRVSTRLNQLCACNCYDKTISATESCCIFWPGTQSSGQKCFSVLWPYANCLSVYGLTYTVQYRIGVNNSSWNFEENDDSDDDLWT